MLHPRGRSIAISADCTDTDDSIRKLVKDVSKNEDHVYMLVNNAGVTIGMCSVEKCDEGGAALKEELWKENPSRWETVYRTNVIGCVSTPSCRIMKTDGMCVCRHFFTSVVFLPLLSAAARDGRAGTTINMSSISSITRTTQHYFKYSASNAATIHLAREIWRLGVNDRVNNIAPGIFPSEMTGEARLVDENPVPVC